VASPTHYYSSYGKYWVGLSIRDAAGCTSTKMLQISVVPVPNCEAKFVGSVDSERTARFSNYSTGNPNTYFWTFGDGKTSNEFAPTHQYSKDGKFTVCLTVSGPDCPNGSDNFCSEVVVSKECCDRWERDSEKDIVYDNGRKRMKCVLYATNSPFHHRVGGKTKSQRKSNTGLWLAHDVPVVHVQVFGSIYIHGNIPCEHQTDISLPDTRKKKHKAKVSEPYNPFGTKKEKLRSRHYIVINDTDYIEHYMTLDSCK
jgi:PKD repeat protein